MAFAYGKTIPSPPKTKPIGNPGGVKAPSGPSVAAQMVKNNRGGQRAQHQPREHQPRARAPRAPKYNALNSPYGTQKAFNKGVEQTAKSEYQPELDQLNTEESGEQGLTAQRQSDNVNIYKQFSEQAQQAFEKARNVMSQIASRQKSSTAAGQAALQAALSNTGVSGLPPTGDQNQFMTEAAGLGNAGSQELAGMQTGLTGEMAKDLSVPGIGLGEATQTEQARDTGALNKIGAQRRSVLANVPNIIAKTRGEMTKQEQEREANKLQGQIASGKLNLEKGTQKQNVSLERAKIKSSNMQHHEDAVLKAREFAVNAGFEEQKIAAQREDINNKIREAKNNTQKLAAELAGKRFDKGLQTMASYLKENPKTEFQPSTLKPNESPPAEKKPYQRNAQHLYDMLTKQDNMTAPEAFQLMVSSGNGYIEQFAHTHWRIFNEANARALQAGKLQQQKNRQFKGIRVPAHR